MRWLRSVALAVFVAALPALPGTAQTIGQPIRLHDADRRVNVGTSGNQGLRFSAGNAVAPLAGGGFVVTWGSDGQDGSASGVFARRFAADGTPLDAADIPVNVTTFNNQWFSAVAALASGGFLVTWMSYGQDGDGDGIFARRFAADGTPLDAADIPVNDTTTGNQQYHAVAALAGGGYVVTWQSDPQDGSGSDIFARRFAADGTPLDAADIPVNVTTAGRQSSPAVASRADGSFVVAWSSRGPGEVSDDDIFARRFAADGTPLDAADIPVNVTTAGRQSSPALASRADGSFVVTWESRGPEKGSEYDIFARGFAADGTPLDVADIPVNATTASSQENQAVSALAGGGFVVTWTSYDQDGSEYGIYARRFAADGTALDVADIAINVTTLNNQVNPSIAALTDGDTVAIVWEGNGPGDDQGIFFNRFRVAGAPVARDDTASARPGQSVTIPVLANDADADVGDSLTVTAASATHGNVTINGDGTLAYTAPTGCDHTADTISYTLTDSTSKTASATVAVAIDGGPIMTVTPTTVTRLYGGVGGPFPGPYGTYTIANTGCGALSYNIGRTDDWVNRTPMSGTLAPGPTTEVAVRPSAHARALAAGTHTTRLRFRNTSNNVGNTSRAVVLNVAETFARHDFGTAATLSGASGGAWSSNVGGTGEPGEPDHGGVSMPLASVWWNWTAPATGRAVFTTSGSGFDTVLAVYTGDSVDALTEVTANDDFATIAPQSRVGFDAVAGTTYRIAVDGKGAAEGQIKLNWTMP
jgi:VCBS repeat-containing protein